MKFKKSTSDFIKPSNPMLTKHKRTTIIVILLISIALLCFN
ncbi:hypothetical protein [uncultured Legionella sp.]|nr:hypothetical protein [uncultured Legionella sp.]